MILDVPGSGQVEQRHEITSVSPPFISFRNSYTFLADGAVITSDSIPRFRSREEVESILATQGYRVPDVREAPTARATSSCSSPNAPPEEPHPYTLTPR